MVKCQATRAFLSRENQGFIFNYTFLLFSSVLCADSGHLIELKLFADKATVKQLSGAGNYCKDISVTNVSSGRDSNSTKTLIKELKKLFTSFKAFS